MNVSIIIVNYNTNELLKNCVRSIYTHTRKASFEVIIVDNNSPEPIPLEEYASFERLKIIQLPQNIGFGKANNEGIKEASGEFVCFLNSDTLLLNDAISILVDYLKEHSQVGICGGNLYTMEEQPNMSYTLSFPTAYDYLKLLFLPRTSIVREETFNRGSAPKEIQGYISGADILIRKSMLARYGGFDPAFFMYFEDVELCHRMRKNGFEIHSVPAAKIIHLQGSSTQKKGDTLKARSKCWLLRSAFLYFRKSGSKRWNRLFWMGYYLKASMALIYYRLKGNNYKSDYWKLIRQTLKEIQHEKII